MSRADFRNKNMGDGIKKVVPFNEVSLKRSSTVAMDHFSLADLFH